MSVQATSPAPTVAPSATRRGILYGSAAVLIWALYMALAKQGVNAGLSGVDFAFLRFATAGLVMLPFLLRKGVADLAGVGWRRGFVLALLAGPLFILAGTMGFVFAPLAHGAVVQPAAIVIVSTALAWWMFKERPPAYRLVGIGVLVAGLAVISGPSLWVAGRMVAWGDALFVTAGALWAGFTVATRRWNIPAVPATAAVAVLSMLAVGPAYVLAGGLPRLTAMPIETLLVQVLVQGVLSGVVAVVLFTRAAELVGAARAATFPALVPAAAIVVGIPVAGEWPNAWQLGGLAVVSVGLLVAIGALRRAAGVA
jgi:drug/metabolite transporter (DMT)-like permease